MGTPSEEDWKKMHKLVDAFYNRPDAEPFRVPVEWKALGLYDYPQIIAEPMDLGTVKSNIKDKKYKTLNQIGHDVNKVWANCKEYNRVGSDFHKLAGSLQKKWDEKFSKLIAECRTAEASVPASTIGAGGSGAGAGAGAGAGGSGDDGGKVGDPKPAPTHSDSSSNKEARATLADRRAFAKSLFQLSKEDVGKLLVDLEGKCPSALVRNASEDEVELNVDKIPAAILQEMTQFVLSQKKKKTPSNKRAKTTKA